MGWKLFGRAKAAPGGREDDVRAELRGAPPHARVKTYSAQTGYVYQYVYRGYRPVQVPPGRDYVFEIRQSQAANVWLSVRLQAPALAACAERAGRPLLNAEHYAIAKMTLFAGLDEVPNVTQTTVPWTPDADTMIAHLQTLGRL